VLRTSVSETREFAPGDDIITQGQTPERVHLVLEGWAGRYKILPEGERMIMAYLIPGDLCDVQLIMFQQMDHSIGALSKCEVGFIPRQTLAEIIEEHGRLSKALWWCTSVDEAVLREWLVTIGRRPADKRVAHLICEMLLR
jgi:CRP-like cAMP-binding protein